MDVAKLPAASTKKIQFEADIKPILEASCLRCHGPEKPKSRFRLDNKEMALKGGENGVDILPGQSEKSPLIHYIAGLVEDMKMPPKGKADPLSKDQISVMRAWIDQGVDWTLSSTSLPPKLEFSVTPMFRYYTVSGSEQKFRERTWQHESFGGGLTDFWMKERLTNDTTFTAEGRLVYNQDDFRIKFAVDRPDLGFVHGGFEQYRKYSDDIGGYYAPFGIQPFDLNKDLHLDIGRAWLDFGLTLPHLPKLVLGYEYQYKDGSKNLLEWGDVLTPTGGRQKIYPADKDLSEQTHILKLDVSHDLWGVQLEDNLRVEFHDERNARFGYSQMIGDPGPFKISEVDEKYNHWEAANTFRLERQVTDWLLLTGGYLYTRLHADAFMSRNAILTPYAAPPATDFDTDEKRWFTRSIILGQESHVINFNAAATPWKHLNLSAGVQTEWMRQDGIGDVQIDEGIDPLNLLISQPVYLNANLDRVTVDENFTLRFTAIPCTVVFADAHFQQESISQNEQRLEAPPASGQTRPFLRDTEATSDLLDLRAGFTVSPWQQVSLTAHYKYRIKDSDYNHLVDQLGTGSVGFGYPAFIRARDLNTDEIATKLTVKPANWLKTTLSYQIVSTDYDTVTDALPGITPGGLIDAGDYNAHIYSVNATITPWSRLYFNLTFSFEDDRTRTKHNDLPIVADYRGKLYNAVGNATFVLNPKTDLNWTYSYSRADYIQNNDSSGLPLGIVYRWHGINGGITRHFKKNLTGNLQYAFYLYDEASSAHAADFTAHGVMASLSYKMP